MKSIVNRVAVPVATLLAGLIVGGVGTGFAAGSFQGFPTVNVTLNGKAVVSSDVPAFVIADRTVLPVRAISEALGLDVKFDQASNTVVLTSKTAGAPTAPTTGEAVTFGNLKVTKPFGTRNVVIGEVTNNSPTAVSGAVAVAFYDKDGKLLARSQAAFPTVAPGQTKTFETTGVDDSEIAGYTSMKAEATVVNKR